MSGFVANLKYESSLKSFIT